MEDVLVEGLNVPVAQVITEVRVINPRALERLADGIKWHGQVNLLSDGKPLGNRAIRRAIATSSMLTFEALNAQAQTDYSKDYDSLTVEESNTVQGTVLGNQIVAAIAAADAGISVEDATTLVTVVVNAIVPPVA
jgi:hypothetical protein